MGSNTEVMIAVLLAGIQEVILRASMKRQDAWFRHYILGRTDDVGDEVRERQHDAWAATICQGMVIETFNIVVSAAVKWQFTPESQTVYDFGNGSTELDVIVPQMVFALVVEYIVDFTSLMIEAKQNIPVLEYFDRFLRCSPATMACQILCLLTSLVSAFGCFQSLPTFYG